MTELYDINFCFPIRELENERVKLTPFIPSFHGDAFWAGTQDHPEMYTYLPFGPFPDRASFCVYIDQRFRSDPANLMFAVLDKSSPGTPLAGLVGFLYASPENLSVEIAMLMCLPQYHRKGMTHAAVALLVQYCLLLPREGGLGLRRLQWQTHSANTNSQNLARKLGFQFECVQRWQRVLRGDKLGNGVPERVEDPMPGTKGRDTMVFSLCWDDWEEQVKSGIRSEHSLIANV